MRHTHDDEVYQQWRLYTASAIFSPKSSKWTAAKIPGCDSRNTALGASSPANPALHIPELQTISHEHRYCLSSDGNFKDSSPTWPWRPELWPYVLRRPGNTYPLSMTRAATSSTLIENISLAVLRHCSRVASGIQGPFCRKSRI